MGMLMGNKQGMRNAAAGGPEYVSHTSAETNNGPVSLSIPSSLTAGDLLLILIGDDSQKSAATPSFVAGTSVPSGWAKFNEWGNGTSDSHIGIFYRIVDGSEGSSVNIDSTQRPGVFGFCVHITGATTTLVPPIGATGSAAILRSNALTIPGITGNESDLGLFLYGFDGGDGYPFSLTSSTGWTLREGIQTGTSGWNRASGCFGTRDSGASSSPVTVDPSANDGQVGVQIRIQ
tara:strand:- start:677 stop:1375 length:699 start_codon:yes stop_codon:yes gene_type:complete